MFHFNALWQMSALCCMTCTIPHDFYTFAVVRTALKHPTHIVYTCMCACVCVCVCGRGEVWVRNVEKSDFLRLNSGELSLGEH